MDTKEFVQKYSVERRGTNCCKWDELKKLYDDDTLISMWVADMEFKTSTAVLEAMKKRIDHGVFGYSYLPDSYFAAFSNWMEKHHNWPIKKDWVRFSTGVVSAFYWMINAFSKPGDAIIILTPVYYPFHNAIKQNDRKMITVDLINTNGYFTIDYDAFEKAIVDNKVKLFIQSSPHNPAGRVWTEAELDKVLAICKKHGVLVISDEIHQDIILGDKKQIPAAIVAGGKYVDNLIVLSAASKTFNLAGLIHSHIVIPDDKLREQYDAYALTVNHTGTNIMGAVATQAAYEQGEEWLSCVLQVIRENYAYLKAELLKVAPKLVITPLEGTYLAFVDVRAYVKPEDTKTFIQDKCRLAVDFGEWFGENYKGFVRLNLATDPKYVHQAVANMQKELAPLVK